MHFGREFLILKIKIFQNKGYDVIIPDYDVKFYHVN